MGVVSPLDAELNVVLGVGLEPDRVPRSRSTSATWRAKWRRQCGEYALRWTALPMRLSTAYRLSPNARHLCPTAGTCAGRWQRSRSTRPHPGKAEPFERVLSCSLPFSPHESSKSVSSGAPQDTGECPPVPQSVCEQAENPGRRSAQRASSRSKGQKHRGPAPGGRRGVC